MIPIDGILLAVDFSKESTLATMFAVSMAQEYKTELYMLHVLDTLPLCDYLMQGSIGDSEVEMVIGDFCRFPESLEEAREKAKEDLSNAISPAVMRNIHVEEILEEGHPVHHMIVEKAKELGVDVIIIGTHGRTGLAHVLLGSVAEHVIRYASCPVLVIRGPKEERLYVRKRGLRGRPFISLLSDVYVKWTHDNAL